MFVGHSNDCSGETRSLWLSQAARQQQYNKGVEYRNDGTKERAREKKERERQTMTWMEINFVIRESTGAL